MIARPKQAGNLLALVFLAFLWPMDAKAAAPLSHTQMIERAEGPSNAGQGKTFSLGSVLDGLSDSLGSLAAPSPEESDRLRKATQQKEEAEKKAEELARRKQKDLETQQAAAKGDEKPAPIAAETKEPAPTTYKVYTAPQVPEEEPVNTPLSATSPLYEPDLSARVDESLAPPVPVGAIPTSRKNTKDKKKPAKQTNTGQSLPMTAVSALPKQYMPLLPPGSGEGAKPQLLPIAGTRDLAETHPNVTRAIIAIHDLTRNAAESLATLMTLAGEEENQTLMLAPQFPLEVDLERFAKHLPDNGAFVARWTFEDGWHLGGESRLAPKQKGISSFTAIDVLLMFLGDKERFPSLNQVVIVGHGMGGDFVQRYAAAGRGPALLEKEGLSLRFVVANPSSYLYVTKVRPIDNGKRMGPVDAKTCETFNRYPYGLEELPPYVRQMGANALRLAYPARRVSYLVGDRILVDHYLDRSCAAMAQGTDRAERGRFFARYLAQSFGQDVIGRQSMTLVPGAGYDPVLLYSSSCGMASLFGDGECL